jgi:hypothetical protein
MKPKTNLNFSKYMKHNKLRERENVLAKIIAVVVRNSMEDFHCKYLSDAQMKELNPLIRNAIYTALVNLNEKPLEYAAFYALSIPEEDCQLIES